MWTTLNNAVFLRLSIILLVTGLTGFDGGPPPVLFLLFLLSENLNFAHCCRFFHLSLTSLGVRNAFPNAFTPAAISAQTAFF